MKTHEEIKQALKLCGRGCYSGCPYNSFECVEEMSRDTLTYIQQLENQLREATKRVEQLEAAQPKWIRANDNPPEHWKENDKDKTLINYLVYSPDYGVDIGNYVKPANTWVVMGLPAKVTYWMPLTESPNEGLK